MNKILTPDPAHTFSPGFPAEFAQRFHYIMTSLAFVVAARFRILGPITILLWSRLARAHQRITSLIARLAAGRLQMGNLKPGRSNKTPNKTTPGTRRGGPPEPQLPRAFFWLVRILGYKAARYRRMLEALLLDPTPSPRSPPHPPPAAPCARSAGSSASTCHPPCNSRPGPPQHPRQHSPRHPISRRAPPPPAQRRQRPRPAVDAITPAPHPFAKPA